MPIPLASGSALGSAPARIAGLYAAFALLWIWLSDRALVWLGYDGDDAFLAAAVKGSAFVLVTAGLLFLLVRREVAAARRAERLLRAVVDGTTDAVFAKDRDGRYLLFNEAAARLVGKPAADVLGRDDTALFDPDGARRVMDLDRRVMAAGQPSSSEEELTAAGITRTYLAAKAPFRDESGAVAGLVGISRDVTDRKRVEEALRAERDRFEKLVETAPAVIHSFLLRPDGTACFLYASRRIEDIYGVPRERLATDAAPVFARIHPDDLGAVRDGVAASARDLTVWLGEFRVAHPTRGEVWVEVRSAPVRGADGSTVWHGFITDVTVRKQADDRLRESEWRFRQVFEHAATGIGITDAGGRFLQCNPAYCAVLGRTEDELRAADLAELIHPDDRAENMTLLRRLAAGEIPRYEVENRFLRPSGEPRWVHKWVTALDAEAGRAACLMALVTDVTDRRRAEDALREGERRYRELFEAHPLPMWVFDRDTLAFLAVNDAAVAGYGYTRDEFLRMTIADIRPPEDVPALRADVAAPAAGFDDAGVWRHRLKDGRVIRVRVTSHPLAFAGRPAAVVLAQDVTAQLAAEEELRASEDRLRLALAAGRMGTFDWDVSTGSLIWSDTHYHLWGYPTDDAFAVEYRHFADRLHPDDRAGVERAFGEAIAARGPYAHEYRVVHPDGTERWVAGRGEFTLAADGTPVRMLGTVQDVTARKRAEEAVKASEERYRRLVEVLPEAVFINADDRVAYCNPACVALFGAADAAALVGKSTLDLFAAEFHDAIRGRISAMRETGGPVPGLDERVVRLDGRHVPVHEVATPITEGGRAAILVCLRDLSERERTLGLLRTVLGSVTDAILTIDHSGRVESANPATERLFGYSEGELVGRNVRALMPEPDRGRHDGYIANYLRTGEARVIGIGREVVGRRKDGSTFPAELTVTEFALDGGRRFTGVLRDITARKRLEEQFRQAQKMEAVGRLAGGVAHDFNNLLTVINGYADLLLLDLPPEAPSRPPLAAVRDAGERAAALTAQLLAFSRKAIIAPRVFDLKDVAAQAERLLRRLIGEDVVLALVLHPAPCRVLADPNQVDQVILNLAVNARDAMPTGGRLTLEVRPLAVSPGEPAAVEQGVRPGRYVELTVADTGCGMDAATRARIFEPFFTTKGEGKGTGLGLATVFGIVQQAGGQVAVDSAVGRGTTFRILLPEAEGGVASVEAVRPAAGRGSEVVLLVEDDDAVRALSTIALESQGYTVLAAADGPSALSRLRTEGVAARVLVTDVVMPQMSGRELADAARAVSPGLRVLFVSGYTDDEVFRHGVRGASDAFLQKPFSPMGMARKVREVLDAPAG